MLCECCVNPTSGARVAPQARDELDSKYYGAPLALTQRAGKEDALLPGHTTLAGVLDRARAETETGKREVLAVATDTLRKFGLRTEFQG